MNTKSIQQSAPIWNEKPDLFRIGLRINFVYFSKKIFDLHNKRQCKVDDQRWTQRHERGIDKEQSNFTGFNSHAISKSGTHIEAVELEALFCSIS